MSDEFKKAYSELELDDKRNELNNEMKISLRLLNVIKQTIGVDINSEDTIQNYHILDDHNLSESEMLDRIYYDFYLIQKNILDIADSIIKK